MLVGHGSKAPEFFTAMKKVALALKKNGHYREVLCAFLEVSPPFIPDAIASCVRRGASEVRVLPYFVLTGKHVTRDIPRIVKACAEEHRSKAKVVLCPYLGYDAHLVSLVQKRLKENAR